MEVSAGPLIVSLMVSVVGFAIFWYGRKQHRIPHLVAGILMMIFPYFISNMWLILGIAVVLGGGAWLAARMGL
jgi:hypothetical protein